jgi:hypothetical protein
MKEILTWSAVAMKRNRALQAELIASLETIKNKLNAYHLNAHGQKIYEKELDTLRAAIQQSLKVSKDSTFFEKNHIVKCIMKMISIIDKEIAVLEKEMHGMEFYPSKIARLEEVTFKQTIKIELNTMRDKVIGARHEASDKLMVKIMEKLE